MNRDSLHVGMTVVANGNKGTILSIPKTANILIRRESDDYLFHIEPERIFLPKKIIVANIQKGGEVITKLLPANIMKNNSWKPYTMNENAFILWLDQEGHNDKTIGEIVGRTKAAIAAQKSYLKQARSGRLPKDDSRYPTFLKSWEFLARVRTGLAEGALQAWEHKVAEYNALKSAPITTEHVDPVTLDAPTPPPKVENVEEQLKNEELLSFSGSLTVNMNTLKKVMSILSRS